MDVFSQPGCVIANVTNDITEVYTYRSNWQWVSIGSGNGLVPAGHQAITWTNADQEDWGHIVLTGHNGFKNVSVLLASLL